VVTVEEHSGMGGFGAAVLEALSAGGVDVPTRVMAAPDVLHEHGTTRASIGLDTANIARVAEELVRARATR
jgi:deoxyxylulose-5-phosphate synthase